MVVLQGWRVRGFEVVMVALAGAVWAVDCSPMIRHCWYDDSLPSTHPASEHSTITHHLL